MNSRTAVVTSRAATSVTVTQALPATPAVAPTSCAAATRATVTQDLLLSGGSTDLMTGDLMLILKNNSSKLRIDFNCLVADL